MQRFDLSTPRLSAGSGSSQQGAGRPSRCQARAARAAARAASGLAGKSRRLMRRAGQWEAAQGQRHGMAAAAACRGQRRAGALVEVGSRLAGRQRARLRVLQLHQLRAAGRAITRIGPYPNLCSPHWQKPALIRCRGMRGVCGSRLSAVQFAVCLEHTAAEAHARAVSARPWRRVSGWKKKKALRVGASMREGGGCHEDAAERGSAAAAPPGRPGAPA